MRAAVCSTYGPPEVVEVTDVDPPAATPGRIRIRIEAAAVNFPDVLLVANEYQVHVPTPFIPGSEFAGRVIQSDGAIALGTRVFGSTMVGAFASEIVVDPASVTVVPDGVSAAHAAAFGVAHRTAYNALRSVAELQGGEELVVLGAGGGVGLAAVQIGAALGATVTAVASSTEKLDVAAASGAARVVNHAATDLRAALKEAVPAGTDVVIDPVGGRLSEPALRCLHWGGRFVTVGFAAGIPEIPLNLVLLKGVHILGFEFRGFGVHSADEMRRNDAELLELWQAGRVSPHIGATFTLDETAQALRHVADGRAIGKIVVEIT
jgi:NADPH2:quinone reductase